MDLMDVTSQSINSIKRERFHMSIRKKNLETVFKKNRQLGSLTECTIKQTPASTQYLLQKYLDTKEDNLLEELCIAIDSSDLFQTYQSISCYIKEFKAIILQKPQKKLFQILNNCLICDSKMAQQLTESSKDASLIQMIFQIMNQHEYHYLREVALETLTLLAEQENEVLDLLNHQVVQDIVTHAEEYMQQFGEFLCLYLKRRPNLQIQPNVAMHLLNIAMNTKNIKNIYGAILLMSQLGESDFTKSSNIYSELIGWLSENLTDFENNLLLEICVILLKKRPDLIISFKMDSIYEIITTSNDQQVNFRCTQLIGKIYSAYKKLIQQYNFEDEGLIELIENALLEYFDKFTEIFVKEQIPIEIKIKTISHMDNFIKLQKLANYGSQGYYQNCFELFQEALENDNQELILFSLHILRNIISDNDLQKQERILQLIPKKLINNLLQLSLSKNDKIVELVENMDNLIQFC